MWGAEVERLGRNIGRMEGLVGRVQRGHSCSGQEGKSQGGLGEEWVEGFGDSG